jgi:hypothetical protein
MIEKDVVHVLCVYDFFIRQEHATQYLEPTYQLMWFLSFPFEVKILFCPMFSSFRKSIAVSKARNLRSFVLLVRAISIWRWVWSTVAVIIDRGNPQVFEDRHFPVSLCPPVILNILTWDQTRAYVVRCPPHTFAVFTQYHLLSKDTSRTEHLVTHDVMLRRNT